MVGPLKEELVYLNLGKGVVLVKKQVFSTTCRRLQGKFSEFKIYKFCSIILSEINE